MNNYIANQNQTLLDIALHAYGTIDHVMLMVYQNNISLTQDITAGSTLQLASAKSNILVKKAMQNRNIIPATGYPNTLFTQPQGIGYMIIENDFIVQ